MFDDLIVKKKNENEIEGWTCVYCGNVKHKDFHAILACSYCKEYYSSKKQVKVTRGEK